jgi:hypothetical protein
MRKNIYSRLLLIAVYIAGIITNNYYKSDINHKLPPILSYKGNATTSIFGYLLSDNDRNLDTLVSALSPGLSYCKHNPFLKGYKREVIETYERRYYNWRISGQFGRLYSMLTDYFHAEGVHPEDPSAEDGHFMTYHTKIGNILQTIVYPTKDVFPCKAGLKSYANKILCDLDQLAEEDGCIIYSLGSNNEFNFEQNLSTVTKCQIFTFDCTSSPPKTNIKRVYFEETCVGHQQEPDDSHRNLQLRLFPYPRPPKGWESAKAIPLIKSVKLESYHTIMRRLNQTRIDVLKLDIEGAEYGLFVDLLQWGTTRYSLPYQLSFETHWWHRDIGHAMLTLQMFEELWRAGYRFISNIPQSDSSCFEWTALRVFC